MGIALVGVCLFLTPAFADGPPNPTPDEIKDAPAADAKPEAVPEATPPAEAKDTLENQQANQEDAPPADEKSDIPEGDTKKDAAEIPELAKEPAETPASDSKSAEPVNAPAPAEALTKEKPPAKEVMKDGAPAPAPVPSAPMKEAPPKTVAPVQKAPADTKRVKDPAQPTAPQGDAGMKAEKAEDASDSKMTKEPVKTVAPNYGMKMDVEERRRELIEKAIENDATLLRQKRSVLDFSNDAVTLGEPFLGSGALKDYDITWFGKLANSIRPRAQFYGTLRNILYGGRINDDVQGQWAFNLDFDFNFELTNTERIHVRYQPFVDVDEPQGSGIYRFYNDGNEPDFDLTLTEDSTFAWFEGEVGEMFDFLAPNDSFPADINFSVGIVPIIYQNGYLANDNVVGLVVSKPNMVWPFTTNVHFQVLAAIDGVNASRTGAADNDDADLYGATLQIDAAHNRNFELNYFHIENTVEDDLSQDFFAGSYVSSYGLINYSFRALFNVNDERNEGDGQLYVFEFNRAMFNSHYFDKNYGYATVFYGTEGWNDAARGNTTRAGIFFRGNGVSNFPILKNTGADSIGISTGLKLFYLREFLTVNPEFSYLVDTSAEGNDQFALGAEVQYILSNHFSIITKGVGIHNEERKSDIGASVELQFKF